MSARKKLDDMTREINKMRDLANEIGGVPGMKVLKQAQEIRYAYLKVLEALYDEIKGDGNEDQD